MKGLVLAGGESRRFGRDKALTPWRDDSSETFAERAFRALRGTFDDVWVSCRPSQGLSFTGNLLFDRHTYSEGPGAALRAAHQKFPDDLWFVLACDYPHVDKTCVAHLLERWKPELAALVFEGGERHYEPLVGIWSPRALAPFLASPAPGPQAVMKSLGASAVPCPNPQWLLNINTDEAGRH